MGAINTASKLVSLHFKVLASANCLEFCILFKSDLSRSYTCTKLISALYLKPVKMERKITEQMYGTITKDVQMYCTTIASQIYGDFIIEVDCINAEKDLIKLPNSSREWRRKYKGFRCLKSSDQHFTEQELPTHIILRFADYQTDRTPNIRSEL